MTPKDLLGGLPGQSAYPIGRVGRFYPNERVFYWNEERRRKKEEEERRKKQRRNKEETKKKPNEGTAASSRMGT